jgi:hypothetical protein
LNIYQHLQVLYDSEYEIDPVVLLQSLLLMTYWYETPDDQKDSWRWMAIAISLAHTIELHRSPDNPNVEPHNKKLWKRIWWSCFMRDRVIALGMRRPALVKDKDYDVLMLTEDDFEVQPLSKDITIIPMDCTLVGRSSQEQDLSNTILLQRVCLHHLV